MKVMTTEGFTHARSGVEKNTAPVPDDEVHDYRLGPR